MALQPRLKAFRVVDVSTRHEHPFSSELDLVATYGTSRGLWLGRPTGFAVLFLYL
jgi:hypothetical protein